MPPSQLLPLGVTAVTLPELDFDEQLSLCGELRVTHYSLRPRIIPPDQRGKPWGNWGNHKFDLTPERLVREADLIRRKLGDAGMTPFATLPATNILASDDVLKQHFEGAQGVGAGRVRVAPPPVPTGIFNYADLLEQVVSRYKYVVALAKPFGQKIVIETHCQSIAPSPAMAMNICRHFAPAELGLIFDIANFAIEGNYLPHLAVSVLGEYIDHVHIGGCRRTTGPYDTLGFRQVTNQMCPLTESDLYIPAWIDALLAVGRFAPLIIENETDNLSGAARLTESAQLLWRLLESRRV